MAQTVTQEEVFEALKTVYDPEIPVNVVDLGLIYEVQVNDENNVYVQLTLTFPEVEIELVFDPPLSPDLISAEAREQLGI